MAEVISGKKVFSLNEFVSSIQRMFTQHYCGRYWLKAEISKLNLYTKTGHCYPDLVENSDGKNIAAVSAFIHKKNLQAFNEKFVASVGEPLKDGMKIFALCAVNFSKNRGVRLELVDIDIDSIIGEQARNHQVSILKLKSEGVYALNKNLSLPAISKRIAVVSVETSKGYQDFSAIIQSNPNIMVKLFPAQMLGAKAVGQIIDSMREIKRQKDSFDAVCIIRAGGGEVSLQCFNDLDLSREVATFPIPVLTGIGHVTNKTVVEEVAHQEFVSPSDLAKFLVDRFKAEQQRFSQLSLRIASLLQRHITKHANRLSSPSAGIKYKFKVAFERKYQSLKSETDSIRHKFHNVFIKKRYAMYNKASHLVLLMSNHRQAHVKLLDDKIVRLQPVEHKQAAFKVSKLPQISIAAEPSSGFSIKMADAAISSISHLHEGDIITINTPQGIVTAKVMKVEEKN